MLRVLMTFSNFRQYGKNPEKINLSFENFWKYYGTEAFAPKEQMFHFP